MEAITFTQVGKNYGSVRAVDTLDLTIGAGQAVALLGPNGAGKSTSISMLLGLALPDSGKVTVFGSAPAEAVAKGQV
ncbi:MAG TPA: ATP-binding cassette domain-containing protein, partial [Streptosporangiaceae bacterium]|nr:ATP-binding cassette domain-containing protein [Streptosporangiaceae bacterium]